MTALRASCTVLREVSAGALRRRAMTLAAGLAIGFVSLTSAHDVDAQGKVQRGAIYFQVIDTSVNPLAGAEIVLPHLGLAMQLAEEASLLLVDVPNGMYLVQARHLGYKTEWRLVRVTGDTARAHFMLMPAAHMLDTVDVVTDATPLEGRLHEFLRRSTSNPSGYFLTRDDVERRRPTDVGALLQTVNGVVVQRAIPGPTFVRSRRAGNARCTAGMLVFVDGLLLNSPGAIGGSRQRMPREDSLALRRPRPGGTTSGGTLATGGRAGRRRSSTNIGAQLLGADAIASADGSSAVNTASLFDVNQVPLSTIAGVEVYPSLSGVPPEFRLPGAECGVVLIWMAGR